MLRRLKKLRLLKIALLLSLLLLLLAGVLYFLPQPFLCVDSGPVKADVIIVLGGGSSHERPERAAELYFQHAAPYILVSGYGDDEINRRILLRLGVPAANILVENESKTTRENAEFSIKLLHADKIHSAIIATSWYHSRRALRTFQHYGKDITFYSRPSYFWYQRAHWTHEFFRHVYLEYIKLPGYWFGYGVCPF